MAVNYMATPKLRALSKLINLYYYFKVGYDNGLADDLSIYVLEDDELEALQGAIAEAEDK